MLRLGVAIQETWAFFNEIYHDFQRRYEVSVFKRRSWELPVFHSRINQFLYSHDLSKFMAGNDVVFFEWASELLVAASHMPKVNGIVTRLHRYEMYRWVDRVNWDAVDRIILVSNAKKTEFAKRYPTQADKIVIIQESIKLDKFMPQPKTFKGDIGILCNLAPRKRVYELILTFYELRHKRSDLHLHIGGGMQNAYEDYYEALHHIVKELNLQDSVTFYGNVTNTWDWFHNIDVFISNSYSEGLQVAPIEAMASGCYCLAHRWHGAEELLPVEYLYYTGDELKTMIERYCELSEGERNIHRQNMRSIAEKNFDINQAIEKINQTIKEVAIDAERKFGKK